MFFAFTLQDAVYQGAADCLLGCSLRADISTDGRKITLLGYPTTQHRQYTGMLILRQICSSSLIGSPSGSEHFPSWYLKQEGLRKYKDSNRLLCRDLGYF